LINNLVLVKIIDFDIKKIFLAGIIANQIARIVVNYKPHP